MDEDKTKKELMDELQDMRHRFAELEKLKTEGTRLAAIETLK